MDFSGVKTEGQQTKLVGA